MGNFKLDGCVKISISIAAFASAFAFPGCGGGSSGSSFNAPAVAPIVNSALPAGLQAGSTAVQSQVGREISRTMLTDTSVHDRAITPINTPSGETTKAQTYIKQMFTEYYNNPNDGKGYQGYLNNLVIAIDARMSLINKQISGMGSSPSCLSGSVTSEVFDLSAIDSMLKFTTPYTQCSNVFSSGGGNVAGSGSGAAFGTDGKGDYSLWLILAQNVSGATTFDQQGGFIAVANVLNYGSTSTSSPETVDGLLLSYAPLISNNGNQITLARFTASPTTKTFALFLGSNGVNTSGGASASTATAFSNDSYLGSGLRLVSDGTHVYADGLMMDTSGANTYYNFQLCMNASDLSVDSTASDCSTLANNYVTTAWASLYPGQSTNPNPLATTPSLNYNEVTGCSATVPPVGSSVAAINSSSTGCSSGIPQPGSANQETTPSTTILNALKGLGLPSSLTSL